MRAASDRTPAPHARTPRQALAPWARLGVRCTFRQALALRARLGGYRSALAPWARRSGGASDASRQALA
eukprot:700028-Lingulodinium_polyedra.AAC.1